MQGVAGVQRSDWFVRTRVDYDSGSVRQCKGIWIPDSGKRSGIFVLVGSRFSALESGIQVPLTKNTKPSSWNLESMPWNSESKITLHGASSVLPKGSLYSGGSRRGRPPLFLDQTEARKAEKRFFF